MTQSENIGLNIFEQADKLSMGAFNSNWTLLDSLLKSHGDEIARRAKFACGSYEGTVAGAKDATTDADSKVLTTAFGFAVSSTTDTLVAELDFRPRVFLLAASRATPYSWTATLYNGTEWTTTGTRSGQERQSVFLAAADGMELCPLWFSQTGPAIETHYVGDGQGGMAASQALVEGPKNPVRVNSTPHYSEYDRWLSLMSQVVIGGAESAYTVTVKGGSTAFGTENLADIQGLTYHWVALG